MIKHIVFWTLKPYAHGHSAAENAREVKARLESLTGHIPGLLSLEVGIDCGRTEMSADIALCSEFADRESLNGYQSHPAHLAAVDFIRTVRDMRLVVDYEV